jgi:solute carrier family 35 protein E1
MDLLFFQFAFSALLGEAYNRLIARPESDLPTNGHTTALLEWSSLATIAACQFVGTLMTNASYMTLGATTTQVLKTAEPIFTVALSAVLMKKMAGCCTLLAVFLVVAGLATCTLRSTTFALPGFVCAFVSNLTLPLRNVLVKRIQSTPDMPRAHVIFTRVNGMCTAAVGGVYVIKIVCLGASLSPSGGRAAALFATYQICSFGFLGLTNALLHSVCNVVKRASAMALSVWFFGDNLSDQFYAGLAVTFSGLVVFTLAKLKLVEDPPVSRQVCKKVFLVAVGVGAVCTLGGGSITSSLGGNESSAMDLKDVYNKATAFIRQLPRKG